MSLTAILSNEKTAVAEKLEAVAETVAKARAAYGNEDAEIAAPMVNTAYGAMRFTNLEDDAKLEIIRDTVMRIKVQAVEFGETREGANVNRKIEELLATSSIMVNVGEGSKFEYL